MSGTLPTQKIQLDASNLRGIAHPLRLRILSRLRTDGPATASDLARWLGVNSGATSYHLRQLADYGFIVDEPARGIRRQRWWRAAHANTLIRDELLADHGEGVTVLRILAQVWSNDMLLAVDAAPSLPSHWRDAQDFSDYCLWLTPTEAKDLIRQIHSVLRSRRVNGARDAEEPARFTVQLQMFPTLDGE